MRIAIKCVMLAPVFIAVDAAAKNFDDYREIAQVTWENDIFVGKDGGYTNGLAFSYSKGTMDSFSDENLPGWIQWLASPLPNYNRPGFEYAVSYLGGANHADALGSGDRSA